MTIEEIFLHIDALTEEEILKLIGERQQKKKKTKNTTPRKKRSENAKKSSKQLDLELEAVTQKLQELGFSEEQIEKALKGEK